VRGPAESSERRSRGGRADSATAKIAAALPSGDLERLLLELTEEMKAAATNLKFEEAARLRDEINEMRRAAAEAAP
jgi:excinuclease ABC subunit B